MLANVLVQALELVFRRSIHLQNTMPVSCSAVNCTSRYTKGSSVKFFVFPADPEQQKWWTVAVSQDKWLPSKHDCLCSAHFVCGRQLSIPDDVDYVPSVFTDGKQKHPAASEESRWYGRASKRLKVREEHKEMTFAAEALLDFSPSSTSLPPTKDASTQADLSYTDTDCLVAECNKVKASNLRLSEVVDDLKSKLHKWTSNLRLIQGSDYTGLPTYPCCSHGTTQVYRAKHHSIPPTSQ